jgi:hypothetical protein
LDKNQTILLTITNPEIHEATLTQTIAATPKTKNFPAITSFLCHLFNESLG